MDECDTAALAYQCGQEKAPDLVANAIAAVELNTSAVYYFSQFLQILLQTILGRSAFASSAT